MAVVIQQTSPWEAAAGAAGAALQGAEEKRRYAAEQAFTEKQFAEQQSEFKSQLATQVRQLNDEEARTAFDQQMQGNYYQIARDQASDQHKAAQASYVAQLAENEFKSKMNPWLLRQQQGAVKAQDIANAAAQVQAEIDKKYSPIMAQLGVKKAVQDLWLGALSGQYTQKQIDIMGNLRDPFGVGGMNKLKPEEAYAYLSPRAQNVIDSLRQAKYDPLKAEQIVGRDSTLSPTDRALAPIVIGSSLFKAPAAGSDTRRTQEVSALEKSPYFPMLSASGKDFMLKHIGAGGDISTLTAPQMDPETAQAFRMLTPEDQNFIRQMLGVGGGGQ